MRDFNHTINVLVKAYFNDTLLHNDCCACAVGNLIADAIGAKIETGLYDDSYSRWTRNKHEIEPIWDQVFCSDGNGGQEIYPEKYKGLAKRQIDTVGYSLNELATIERAFESIKVNRWNTPDNDPKYMFDGLMAVVDVLAEIHGIDLTQKEAAKLLFVK